MNIKIKGQSGVSGSVEAGGEKVHDFDRQCVTKNL